MDPHGDDRGGADTEPASAHVAHGAEDAPVELWSARDQVAHEQTLGVIDADLAALHTRCAALRQRIEPLWERFLTLSLEQILAHQVHAFLEPLLDAVQEVNVALVAVDCELDRLRRRISEQQRLLDEWVTQLEPLAHRTSTQSHLGMMLARVERLEAALYGGGPLAAEQLAIDLRYLRIRLRTTRAALEAANDNAQLRGLAAATTARLPEAESLKAEVAALTARGECLSELCRYWLMYLQITGLADGD